MELRQLRYMVRLADELNFGRAAALEHIVQSALSQQIQRLERELAVVLVDRDTHHVHLTAAGQSFVEQARLILDHVERAASSARDAAGSLGSLRVAVGDSSLDSMPQILRNVQYNQPRLTIHRIEASVPAQYRMLATGKLDVGVGRASHAPPDIASEVFRLDPLGVLIPTGHRLAALNAVPVRELAGVRVMLGETGESPQFDEFVIELCRGAGFNPKAASGSAQSVRAAADLVAEGHCLVFVPSSCDLRTEGVVWRPVVDPVAHYPWSLLWRADGESKAVWAVRESARALAAKLRWLHPGEAASPGAPVPRNLGRAITSSEHQQAD